MYLINAFCLQVQKLESTIESSVLAMAKFINPQDFSLELGDSNVSIDVKVAVAATGIIALCLVLSALLYFSSLANPTLEGFGDKFFGLSVVLIAIVLILAILGVKIRFP